MSTIRVQYGLRIKDLRDERGLSQRGFAALIGMSPTYLADIERGARNVSIDNMKRIADGFGVTFHEMTEGRKEWSRNAIPSTYVRWVS
jgi:transcriptional regulator with XRE-family HTH domain